MNNEWQLIESAPKDGTTILGFGPQPCPNPGYEVRQTYWKLFCDGSPAKELFDRGEGPEGMWSWVEPMSNWSASWRPTHWMKRPKFPEEI